ncbi:MAG: hypothetical protein ABH865_00380 [Candidatus Omnitrophota bacterium]
MDEGKLFVNLHNILKGYKNKCRFLTELKTSLFTKKTSYQLDFDIIIIQLQNRVEDIFDRILRTYTRPKQKEEYLYNDEIMKDTAAKFTPEEVRNLIIFNLGFSEKKNLIFKLFKVSKSTKTIIDKLNEMRNAIAHRYSEDDKRFIYKEKNVLHDPNTLINFFRDNFEGIIEILEIETKLLDAIDKAEGELG